MASSPTVSAKIKCPDFSEAFANMTVGKYQRFSDGNSFAKKFSRNLSSLACEQAEIVEKTMELLPEKNI